MLLLFSCRGRGSNCRLRRDSPAPAADWLIITNHRLTACCDARRNSKLNMYTFTKDHITACTQTQPLSVMND